MLGTCHGGQKKTDVKQSAMDESLQEISMLGSLIHPQEAVSCNIFEITDILKGGNFVSEITCTEFSGKLSCGRKCFKRKTHGQGREGD